VIIPPEWILIQVGNELTVLVKARCDHCKTVEFRMKAFWNKDESATYKELKVKHKILDPTTIFFRACRL